MEPMKSEDYVEKPAQTPAPEPFVKRHVPKADGRYVIYYEFDHRGEPARGLHPDANASTSEHEDV